MYNSTFIPIYIYGENKELITCFPKQTQDTHPLMTYLFKLWTLEENASYIETRVYTYYGCIREKNCGIRIVIGPVHPLSYTSEVLYMMHKDFVIEESKTEQFNNFFYNIPRYSLDHFINVLLLINYNVNRTQLNKSDVIPFTDSIQPRCINTKHYEDSIASLEEHVSNHDYEIEKELLGYVETGNITKLKMFFENPACSSDDAELNNGYNLRQKKNLVIIGIALLTRSAIKGGLTPSVAYQLSDVYSRQVEHLSEINSIDSLFVQAAFDYTNRTASFKIPIGTNKVIYSVAAYVNENVYKNITVADIAKYMQLNRSYLSRKFKDEFGIELSSYIRQCKLDEGKNLLNYSKKSIAEISNLLCFSSQSHFQSSFKKQFGVTPQSYRNSDPLWYSS